MFIFHIAEHPEANRCFGDRKFKKDKAKEYLEKEAMVYLEKTELAEWNEMQWESSLDLAICRLDISLGTISTSKFSEPWKLAVAPKIKQETFVSNSWLSHNLNMGNPKAVSANCGNYIRDRQSRCPFAKQLNHLKYEH